MTEQKKPKGGLRENSGRKAKSKEKGVTLRVGFRCSPDVYDILQMQEDKTAYIEAAIREKHRREQW